jgi:hypothetical protein
MGLSVRTVVHPPSEPTDEGCAIATFNVSESSHREMENGRPSPCGQPRRQMLVPDVSQRDAEISSKIDVQLAIVPRGG